MFGKIKSFIDYDNLPLWARDWSFIDLIDKKSMYYGINPYHIIALIKTESNGNRLACRYEPNFKWTYNIEEFAKQVGASRPTIRMLQKTSFGLGQIMGVHFFEIKTDVDHFSQYRWPTILFDVNINLQYTCMIWREKLDQYGVHPETTYAAYNAGSVRYKNDYSFEFANQKAVDNFTANLLDIEKRVMF